MKFNNSTRSLCFTAMGAAATLSFSGLGFAASESIPDIDGLWSFPQCEERGCTVLAEDDARLTDRARAYQAAIDEMAQPKYDCAPMPIPHMYTDPYSFRIEQLEDRVRIYYGKDDVVRTIWLEGHGHAKPAINEFLYFGHAVGRFEGDALVVVTDKFTFDPQGLNADFRIPSSTQKQMTERFSRDGEDLVLEVSTVDTFFLKEPWEFTVRSTPVESLDANWTCELDGARRSLMFETSKYPDDPEPVRIDYDLQEQKSMTSFNKLILTIIGTVTLGAQTFAHHSTRGIYDEDVELELQGTVKEWKFINPHPYLTLSAPDEDGVMRDWDVSYGGAAVIHLQRQGYTGDTFKPGETIIVKGHRALKAGVYGLLMEGGGNIPTRDDGTPVVAGGSMF